ncbi:MAG: hypothetical protein E2O80_02015 [Betaproteobacteria bacterium]|nr:MAG: hypothetical protein E2O80_02015 [Betaproteobacteria bacterium]
MLGKFYKFHVKNNLSFDMDLSSNSANEIINLSWTPWKIKTFGAIVYGTEITKAYTAADIADDASFEFSQTDNSTDLNIGALGMLTYETDDASALGNIALYYEISTDGGTTYPSDAADFIASEDLLLVIRLQIAGDGAGYKRSTPFQMSA